VNNPLIALQQVSIDFQLRSEWIPAVNSISFSLNPGKTLGIVGESGSGKTSLALAIPGLLPPSARLGLNSSILFSSSKHQQIPLHTCSLNDLQAIRGKEIGFIFQEPMSSLNPVMTCGEQIQETIMRHLPVSPNEAREKTLHLLDEVLLQNPKRVYKAYPHELSGGQKQRIMIAIAISCNPSLLIADEPTTALDVTVQRNLIELLKRLQEQYKMALLFISHDLDVVSILADEILVMQNGSMVEHGPAGQILNQAQHPYTKGLLKCKPPMDIRLKTLPTVEDFLKNRGDLFLAPTNIVQPTEREMLHAKMKSKTPIIEVKNLSHTFQTQRLLAGNGASEIQALHNVSFHVYPGETLGIAGESGSGKTTLGRCLMKLLEPTEGQVFFQGSNITQLTQNQFRSSRRYIQMVFQDPYTSLNPLMTAGETIMEVVRATGIIRGENASRKWIIDLLNKVGLSKSFYYRYPNELSGGQRQRINIARALASKPSCLICDEAVSSLDVSIQAQILNLLNELKHEFGFSCIFISHDLSVIRFMSDRVLIMNQGEIVEEGEADALFLNPKHEYTQRLFNSIPQLMDIKNA
jgi:peptide/nickel transport system ATP-binding protein